MKTALDMHESPARPASTPANTYCLPNLRRGDPDAPDPLARHSWPELRELIYGDVDRAYERNWDDTRHAWSDPEGQA